MARLGGLDWARLEFGLGEFNLSVVNLKHHIYSSGHHTAANMSTLWTDADIHSSVYYSFICSALRWTNPTLHLFIHGGRDISLLPARGRIKKQGFHPDSFRRSRVMRAWWNHCLNLKDTEEAVGNRYNQFNLSFWDQSQASGLLSIFSPAFKAISHFQSWLTCGNHTIIFEVLILIRLLVVDNDRCIIYEKKGEDQRCHWLHMNPWRDIEVY